MKPHHRGNIQGTGHDGRVRGGATHFRHKTQRHLPIQQSRVGGRQIVGQNNAWGIQGIQVRQLPSHEVVNHPPPHIENVGRPLPKIRILHFPHALGVGVDHMLVDVLHTDLAEFKLPANCSGNCAVRRHQKMGLKNLRRTIPQRMGQMILDALNLFPGLEQRRF